MSVEGKKSEGVTAPGHIAGTKSATAQRRHELEQNTLAETLQKFKQIFTEGFSRTTWVVLSLVAAAVLLYFVWRFFARNADQTNSELSLKLQYLIEGESPTAKEDNKLPFPMPATPAATAKNLEDFAKANPGTSQGRIAKFQSARIRLTQGQREIGSEATRSMGLESIAKAAKDFEDLQSDFGEVPLLHQEALLRTAQARECLGEFDKALTTYKKLATDYKSSEFGKMAAAGVQRLEDPNTLDVLKSLSQTYSKKP